MPGLAGQDIESAAVPSGGRGAGALHPYRIIDLTTVDAWLAGSMLRDLDADVIKVEPSGGDPGRLRPPFAGDIVDPERSLRWWSYNRGKRSVIIDVETVAGKARLLRLAAEADAVIESYGPGGLEAHGITVEELHAVNPRLVITRISAFGQTGPRADWAVSDLILSAAGGASWMSGDPDRAPVRISVPQYFNHGAAEGAVQTVAALYHARRTGVGQWIDVSAQQGTVRSLMNAFQAAYAAEMEMVRQTFGEPTAAISPLPNLYECADGYVVDSVAFGPGLAAHFGWFRDEGVKLPAVLDALTPEELATGGALFDAKPEILEPLVEVLRAFFLTRTRKELIPAAIARRIMFVGVNTVHDINEDEQLLFRDHFVDIPGPAGETWTVPSRWALLSGTPIENAEPAPTIGQHDAEPWNPDRRWAQPEPTVVPVTGEGQFKGLKVFDASWVGVGPLTAKYLADHGATVVRTESNRSLDVLRNAQPFNGNIEGINRSQFWGDYNTSKFGLGLNLASEEGKAIAHELIRWADVMLESFSPGVMARLGLDYEKVREINPRIVMLSTSMNGQTGPRRTFAGFGTVLAAMGGFSEITGWPDRAPGSPYGAYTDFVAQRFCATALMAAIDHQARTGEGQYIDVSQYEASLQFMAPELADARINGRAVTRMGNRDLEYAPHGVFPCQDEDGHERWVAIAVTDDAQWPLLIDAAGLDDRFRGEDYATAAGRLARQDEIEAALTAWTSTRPVEEIVDALQPRVPAYTVHSNLDLVDDPQLVSREHLVWLEHEELGSIRYENMQAIASVEPATLRKAAPLFGGDSQMVLRDILCLPQERIDAAIASGAVEPEYRAP